MMRKKIFTNLTKIKAAFVASIGNLNVIENSEKSYNIIKKLLMLGFLLYGLCATGIILLGEVILLR